MHPILARFLTADAARETLRKEKAGEPLTPEEQHFVTAADANPKQKAMLLGVSGRALSSDAQAALVLLAAHAAARALTQDEALSAATQKAREALKEEGASDEESDAFLASILLEEAFGYEQEVDSFDADYVKESLGEVPALAALSKESVDALFLAFAKAAPNDADRKAREHMARALFDIAWSEGPTSINPEHLETLLDNEVVQESDEVQDARVRATVSLLQTLAHQGLIGPMRLTRLRAQLGDDDA
ncbi:hypothetical protein JYK02_27885 [Corallococcus macrosporus]|uniref:Co-chaperone DjlA N-terminal domain-containing protein n=1 Tax=Corallococcus macrosporus TaxID=35 RepID=A0ABS3DJ34_9BACT|nr:hypothetical protein [Corallococcus macrosporus]MBN8231337.1 hypothetical protein [Corallococcus macrosporus]